MGSYLNPGTIEFQESLNSEICIDKTGLIDKTNALLRTKQKFICISRPRRFGKSMAADMLAAYYERGEDSEKLFAGLAISRAESFYKHLNQYDVLKINMQEFLSESQNIDEMLQMLKKYLIFDLKECYEQVFFRDEENLVQVMKDIYTCTKHSFVILIDEWDCLFREYKEDKESQRKYLDFLRAWLKDKAYVALAYMTGILPIKKYGSHFALNMFTEYSMTDPGNMAEYFGFTEQEHLGYLTYDSELETVSVPDREVAQEYVNAITTMDWHEVIESTQESRKLLEALWNLDGDAVARGIDKAHKEISILQYNDENSLSCTVHLAFYFAREYYTIVRELPTGKGYADICFIPRKLYADKPAVVIELKWDKSAEGAIAQIKNKEYVEALKDYHGNLLLAGINYDKKEKEHTCVIEQLVY